MKINPKNIKKFSISIEDWDDNKLYSFQSKMIENGYLWSMGGTSYRSMPIYTIFGRPVSDTDMKYIVVHNIFMDFCTTDLEYQLIDSDDIDFDL